MNRLCMEHRASLSAAQRETERIEVRRKKLVESIMDGVPASEVRDELKANAALRRTLRSPAATVAAIRGHDALSRLDRQSFRPARPHPHTAVPSDRSSSTPSARGYPRPSE